MLKLENVSVSVGGFLAIRGVSIEIPKGGFYTLLGNNGTGKTTLFRTIAGVIHPVEGKIYLKGASIESTPTARIISMGLSLCPEGRQLFPKMSVHKNLLMGAYVRIKNRREVEESLQYVYTLFPRLKERSKQLAGTMSGGEQQMLAIGRALMVKPEILMLDEPSIGLAPLVVEMIAEVISGINRSGTTVFLSEQNSNMALRISQYGYVLEDGKIVIQGPSNELLCNEKVKKAYLGA